MKQGDKGKNGPIGFCPKCGDHMNITWDSDTDISSCACGWSNEVIIKSNKIIEDLQWFHKRILETKLGWHILEREVMAIVNAIELINDITHENTKLNDLLNETIETNNQLFKDCVELQKEVKTLQYENNIS